MKTSPYPIQPFSFFEKNFLGILKSRFRCTPRQRSKAFEFKPFWTVSAPFFTLVSAFWGTRFPLFGNALSTFWEANFLKVVFAKPNLGIANLVLGKHVFGEQGVHAVSNDWCDRMTGHCDIGDPL